MFFGLTGCDRINVGDMGNGGDGGDKVAGRLTKGSTRGPCGPKKQPFNTFGSTELSFQDLL